MKLNCHVCGWKYDQSQIFIMRDVWACLGCIAGALPPEVYDRLAAKRDQREADGIPLRDI